MSVALVDEYKTKLSKLNQMIDNYHYDYQPRSFCALTKTYDGVHSEECTCEHKQVCLRYQLSSLECIFGFHGIKPLVDSKVEAVLKEFHGVAMKKKSKGENTLDTLWKGLEYAKKMKEAMEADLKEGREIFLENEVPMKKAVYAADDELMVLKKLVEKEDVIEGEIVFDKAKWSVVDVHLEKELKKAHQRVEIVKRARKNAEMWCAVSGCVAKVDEMLGHAKRVKLENALLP